MKKVKSYRKLIYFVMILCIYICNNPSLQGLDIITLNNPAPGYLNFSVGIDNISAFALYDNYGEPHYTDAQFPVSMQKLLSDGYWYVLHHALAKIYQLNLNLSITDSILLPQFGDSIFIDFHDILLMPNGKYLIAMFHMKKMDLSQIIEGGNPEANVIGVRLLQIDKSGNVYWSWDCFDYLDITEATEDIDLTQPQIDFTHFNSLAIDTDGHILVSLRNLDQIIKLNKDNSNIIWRLGSSTARLNDFTFQNDDQNGFYGFSHQHSIHILPNGNLLLFDNGNLKPTQTSRAVEYSLDQTNKIARKVWEHRKSPEEYAPNQGSVQRLDNGNTIVNWSFTTVQEIKKNGNIALEVPVDVVYRVEKLRINMNAVTLRINNNGLYSYSESNNNTDVKLDIQSKSGNGLSWVEKHYYQPPVSSFSVVDFSSILPYRWVITSDSVTNATGKIIINTENLQGITDANKLTIYKRNKETTGNFSALNTTYNSNTKELSANFSNFGEFIICSNVLSVPTLSEPLNNATGLGINSIFKWNKLIGATSYRIQISSDNTFNNIAKNEITNDTIFNFNDLQYDKLYYWRVCGINTKDTSKWSSVRNFKTQLASPNLLFPRNYKYAVGLTDSLIWDNPIPNTKFWLQLSKDSTFINILENKTNLTSGFYVLNLNEHNQTYYWRVLAVRDNDSSNWSNHNSFTTIMNRPSLYSPANDSLNLPTELNLRWILVNGASSYIVILATDSIFSDTLSQKYFVDENQITLTELRYSQDYYWKVQAVRSTDSSDFSKISKFSTLLTKPYLIKPENNLVDLKPAFEFIWEPKNPVNFYHIQISKDSLFEEIIQDINNIENNLYTTSDLPDFTKLYWRVRYSVVPKISEWSDIRIFSTAKGPKMQIPLLTNPKNNALSQQIKGTFDWGTVMNAKFYKIQISKDTEFKKVIIDSGNILVNSYHYNDFDYNTKYYWRVKAFRSYDSSEWSSVWNMQTKKEPNLGGLALIKPQYDELQVSINDSLIWSKNNNAVKYQLQVSNDSTFSFLTISEENLVLHFYQYNNLEKNRTYFWRVRFITSTDTSDWSEVWEFMTETDEKLFAPQLINPVNNIYAVPVEGYLEWDTVENATSYKISVSKNGNFSSRVIKKSWYEGLVLYYSNFEYNTLYYWRVAGQNDNSVSNWSSTKQFVTELKPIEFVLPESGNEEVVPIGNLKWEKIDGAESYQIILSEKEFFDNIIYDEIINDTLMGYNLEKEKQYFWKIKAFNTNNQSRWSEVFTFFVPKSIDVKDNDDPGISIFPNPANDLIQLSFDSNLFKNISIINCLGEQVYFCNISENYLLKNTFSIDLSTFSVGIYFVVIKGTNSCLTKKIIINR